MFFLVMIFFLCCAQLSSTRLREMFIVYLLLGRRYIEQLCICHRPKKEITLKSRRLQGETVPLLSYHIASASAPFFNRCLSRIFIAVLAHA